MSTLIKLQEKLSNKSLTKKEAKELQKLKLFEQMSDWDIDRLEGIIKIIGERKAVQQATQMDLLRLEYANNKLIQNSNEYSKDNEDQGV